MERNDTLKFLVPFVIGYLIGVAVMAGTMLYCQSYLDDQQSSNNLRSKFLPAPTPVSVRQ